MPTTIIYILTLYPSLEEFVYIGKLIGAKEDSIKQYSTKKIIEVPGGQRYVIEMKREKVYKTNLFQLPLISFSNIMKLIYPDVKNTD